MFYHSLGVRFRTNMGTIEDLDEKNYIENFRREVGYDDEEEEF